MRVRLLKPETFKDDHLADVSMAARFLFMGLWTLADREGRLEDRPKWIRAELLPYDQDVDVDVLLNELANPKAFLVRYEVEGRKFIQLTNFLKHQKPHPREAPSSLPAPIQAKASQGQAKASQGAASRSVSVSVPVSDPVRTELPVQPPSSPSVDSRSDADGEVETARADLRQAITDLRQRYAAFGEIPTDQGILDRPVFQAPSGPVRLETCENAKLMRATAGKLRAYGHAKAAQPSKASREFLVTEAALRAEAREAEEAREWIAENWPEADPQTEADLRGLLAVLTPPLHLAPAIEAELFARYPKADADWAARVERMRNAQEPKPAEVPA